MHAMPITTTTTQPMEDSRLLSAVSYSGGTAVTFSIFNPDDLPQNRQAKNQSARIRARKQILRQASGGETAHVTKPETIPGPIPIERRIRDHRTAPVTTPPIDLDALAAKLDDLAARREATRATSDTRTNDPGVRATEPTYLPAVLESCFTRFSSHRGQGSWSGYRTLVKYWQRHFGGNGPDLRTLTSDHIQAFFEAVPEWQSERSWRKNSDLLYKLLKTACPLTITNKEGLRKDAPLTIDSLPVWDMPRERWFRDRASGGCQPAGTKRSNCGHRRRNLPLLTIAELGGILTACKSVAFMDPIWWETVISHIFFKGDRWEDLWRYRWNDATALQSIDLKRAAFHFTETKKGGTSDVPIPSWLLGRLSILKLNQPTGTEYVYVAPQATGSRFAVESDFAIARSDTKNRERRFKPEYEGIFARAGVEIRKPHELRGVAISYWFKHAPKYRFAATGHSPPAGDVQLKNYITLDEDFRQAVETFPFPDQHRTC